MRGVQGVLNGLTSSPWHYSFIYSFEIEYVFFISLLWVRICSCVHATNQTLQLRCHRALSWTITGQAIPKNRVIVSPRQIQNIPALAMWSTVWITGTPLPPQLYAPEWTGFVALHQQVQRIWDLSNREFSDTFFTE
jgi:hypothetical protein